MGQSAAQNVPTWHGHGATDRTHPCIGDFRHLQPEVLSALFVQLLRMRQKMGLVRLEVVVLDGTTVNADASKH